MDKYLFIEVDGSECQIISVESYQDKDGKMFIAVELEYCEEREEFSFLISELEAVNEVNEINKANIGDDRELKLLVFIKDLVTSEVLDWVKEINS